MVMPQKVRQGAGCLRDALPQTPEIGIVLGSGLGTVAETIDDPVYLPYASIPSMRVSTAAGHVGRFVCGFLEGRYVICMQGRLHPYEGYAASDVVFPIRVLCELGVRQLILTNASGGINTSFEPGDLVAISDHINLTGLNPLVGTHDEHGSTPTPDMTNAYSGRLRSVARSVAAEEGIELREGVYLGVLGPSFETPAEIRAFRLLGADLVGMSTVQETIAAVEAGAEVLGISLVTNMAAGILDEPIGADEIAAIGSRRAADLARLLRGIVRRL
ncbi:MAG: purine-nucleoside phosphorylase [Coriobacteriales bacterium]